MKQQMTTHDLREAYLRFFEEQGHVRIPSAPLIPENDPTTLFTGSGMQPMVPYLLGQPHPQGTRITDSQKSFRVGDIDEIGDNRHTTFFEMLGNWSLGDYFKQEQITWMFEFLTKRLELDPNRIYVTVFRGNDDIGIPRDTESVGIWKEQFKTVGIEAQDRDFAEIDGMQDGRIFYYDESKNWWSRAGVPSNMPVGEPGGPDTEMFWDFGAEKQLHENSQWKDEPCHVNCDCGRFLEIGNNVFMQYKKTESGFEELPQKNVDFGGGLERMMAAVRDNPDVFTIDVFSQLQSVLETLSGKTYGEDTKDTMAFRVVMDHMRAATMLIADGVLPSNKDQGYFVRRLIRRAVRFGDTLGITQNFCEEASQAIIEAYKAAYPEVSTHESVIREEVAKEEQKFRQTLLSGLRTFGLYSAMLNPGDTLSGQEVFKLYQSFGFPLEMSQELAAEKNLKVDAEEFKKLFNEHQEKSRAGAEKKFKGGLADHSEQSVKYHTATHLLHQALRDVLGDHATQKGSNITPERLRFDFNHPDKMTDEQKKQVENIVNEKIQANMPVTREEMTVAEAKEKGALGLFEERYGEKVSVYTMGHYSCEICGGPHVENTGTLGTFRIVKEESAGSGVRRIKAVLE